MMTMIELLKYLRGERSQEEFAALLGISQVAVSLLLSGRRAAGRKVTNALVTAFPERRDEIMAAFFAQQYNKPDDPIAIGDDDCDEGDACQEQ